MAGSMPRGEVLTDLLRESQQAHRIALQIKKVSQRCSKGGGIIGLRVTQRTKSHRAALVGDQMTTQIRFVLEFLNEVPIAAGKDAPIQIARIIPSGVLAILRKLDRKAMVRRFMQTGNKTFYQLFRQKFNIAKITRTPSIQHRSHWHHPLQPSSPTSFY